ncbi:hypothetical protein WJX79_006932 [Trebouxia sp. C0005]
MLHMIKLLLACLLTLSLYLTPCLAGDVCELGGAVIQLSSSNHTYKAVPSDPEVLLHDSLQQMQLSLASPQDACQPLTDPVTGAAVLVQRGSCPFATKAQNVQRANAAAVLVINSDDDCMYMDLNNTEVEAITMPVVSVSKQTGVELEEAAQKHATIALWMPYYSSFDFNVILLWVMAIGTFVLAGVWAGNDSFGTEHSYLQAQDDSEGNASKWQMESQTITQGGAVAFLVIASGSLLLLYFFLDTAFYVVLMGLFSLGAVQALAAALAPLCSWLLPHQTLHPPIGQIPAHAVLSLGISLGVVAVWLVFRSYAWAWVLQDLLGISLIVMVLRQFRLPDIKVACVLLPLSFFYDIFWVFIQPYLTHGDSVMVKVATGGDQHWQLPMLLIVPAFHLSPATGPVILGFGDILLPGLLGVYSRTFDLYHNLDIWQSYFWPTVVGRRLSPLLDYVQLAASQKLCSWWALHRVILAIEFARAETAVAADL